APDDLVHRHEVRLPAEIGGEPALGEGAENAAEVADVRVVDVPRDDIADRLAVYLTPERVGGSEDAMRLLPARLEQPDDLLLAPVTSPVDWQCVSRRERDRHALARRPGVVPGEALCVGCAQDVRCNTSVGPALPIGDVLGVERETRGECQPRRLCCLTEPLELGPRRL